MQEIRRDCLQKPESHPISGSLLNNMPIADILPEVPDRSR